jgi:FtsP/CotA-like multicopper oxidase with cupredoxin domain
VRTPFSKCRWSVALLVLAFAASARAQADIPGVTGPTFDLTASAGSIDTPDGDSLHVWGYGVTDHMMQYPGPTLIVNEGDQVVITLRNQLPAPVSMVFPGQGKVTTAPVSGATRSGILTLEAETGAVVRYTFTASRPGTYLYHSGSRPDVQVEMGLLGALIVRPAGFGPGASRTAYGHPGSAYDHEYLFLLTEMDPRIHNLVEFSGIDFVDTTQYRAVLWFINGRNAPDTMLMDHVSWMPHQPYASMPRMHPGERVLMRLIGAGRDLHPFHHHGNFSTLIARDGRLLSSAPGAGPDLATTDFTHQVLPGSTMDAIFEWTGKGLGFDIYGTADVNPHDCTDLNTRGVPNSPQDGFDDDTDGAGPDLATHEYCEDHYRPMPVALPTLQELTFGGHWTGSPFLGQFGPLPPGQGGLNPTGGYFFMWHSHTEKELVNNDIFPGGMMTMLIIEPPGVPIPGMHH